MHNDLSRRTFMGRFANGAVGVAVVSLDLTACSVDKAKSKAVVISVPQTPTPTPTPTPAVASTVFKQLKIGAGGWVTGIDVSIDGATKVVRCDSYGAYRWDAKTSTWLPLLTMTNMPTGDVGADIKLNTGAGVYEVAVAPNSSQVVYAVFNGRVYRSGDAGVTFARTAFEQQALDPNSTARMNGRRLAVDSASAQVVYLGTPQFGISRTLDGGATWTKSTGVPTVTDPAGVLVAIDHSSPLVAGRRSVVYAHSHQNGVYRSSDGGDTFVALSGSPKLATKMVCGPDGSVFIMDDGNFCYRYRGGAWSKSQINVGWGSFHTVAVNPADKNHVVVGDVGGPLRVSYDGGVTWLGTQIQVRIAKDIPWLGWTKEDYMSSGDIVFDPSNPGSILFAQGIGVWNTSNLNGAAVNWTSSSQGIEQLVSNFFLSIPGGSTQYYVWDRGVFTVTDPSQYPSTHGPSRDYAITHGWHADYAASNPSFVAALFNAYGNDTSGFSLDGGATWAKFASVPTQVTTDGKIGGCIAVGSPDNIVWIASNNGSAWSTQNRGASWTQISLPNIPTTGETGWGWAYYLNRKIVAADKVTPNTIYLYNYLPNVGGVFRSKDGGKTWDRVFAGQLSSFSGYNAKLRAVPGQAGHLFFTEGQLDGANPAQSPLMRSTDGGVTWTKLTDVNEAHGVGFGKAQTAGGYPAVYIFGYVGKNFGTHVSYDECKTWTQLSGYVNNSFDTVTCVEGDMNIFGRVYVGFAGSGAAYGDRFVA